METFFVADQSVQSCRREVDEAYCRENLAAGRGGVKVVRSGGVIDVFAGSRYLPTGGQISAETVDAELRVTFQGTVLRKYIEWIDVREVEPGHYPMAGSR